MKKYFPLLIALVAIALFNACSKKHDPVPVELKTISLGRDTLTLVAGQTYQLNLAVTPTDYDQSLLRLSSSDTTVLTVTNKGKIVAIKAGIAIVKATNDKQTISVTCLVNVVPKTIIDSLKVGLLAYFAFNNSGVDSSGNANHGMVYNISSVPNRFGTANSAYYFNGTTSYIKVKDNQSLRLNNTDITLNSWVKLDVYNASYGVNLLSKRISGVDNGWAWGITGYSIATQGIVTYGPGGGSAFARGTAIIGLNQWHMVTTVYNLTKQQISIYVDGALDNVTYGLPSPNANITTDLYIGKDNPEVPTNGYYVQGALDEIRIYKRALTLNEIKKLYNLTY
ncbi:LamG-like jellyroll fold domain-containing protein [Mucilaginibacter sp. OK283]|uniref:LamG-like jellyroll fold domain-containing protein n=1 Tax=Mucilaginibacter sp. OK283 TaxID=1881049 RepID=UPI0008C33424|nr:LamG-like jellyroll fold domain-containing protein [Mucilaginibacter sp. OK283]SEP29949.1 Ig-like domain (group 2) [Mucilaginibacter sp. OK283]